MMLSSRTLTKTNYFRECFRIFSTVDTPNVITEKTWKFPPIFRTPREAWIEGLDTIDERKLGIIQLHPDVFAHNPRIDIIHQNYRWQMLYKFVSYAHTKVQSEVKGGGRKPWPQKGTGRARANSIRSPQFRGGACVHGPRSPTSHFYMLPFFTRVLGLTSMLSIKLAQDDLHIVKDLEIPTDEQSFIEEIIKARNWGPSVLFIDQSDIMPRNITVATDMIKHVRLMPSYGLNVYSMLKFNTLVITQGAIEDIETKLLNHLNTNNSMTDSKHKYDQV